MMPLTMRPTGLASLAYIRTFKTGPVTTRWVNALKISCARARRTQTANVVNAHDHWFSRLGCPARLPDLPAAGRLSVEAA